eukprot:scaffold12542_cov24-Tisochrysis_lutea.AAC.1
MAVVPPHARLLHKIAHQEATTRGPHLYSRQGFKKLLSHRVAHCELPRPAVLLAVLLLCKLWSFLLTLRATLKSAPKDTMLAPKEACSIPRGQLAEVAKAVQMFKCPCLNTSRCPLIPACCPQNALLGVQVFRATPRHR